LPKTNAKAKLPKLIVTNKEVELKKRRK